MPAVKGREAPRTTATGHGTRYRFYRGCRCAACVEAQRAYMRESSYRRGRTKPSVKATGILSYVECLTSFGLELENIAQVCGVALSTLRPKHPTMYYKTAHKIESLHWGLYRRHYPFRQHCQCPRDLVVLESFEEVTS